MCMSPLPSPHLPITITAQTNPSPPSELTAQMGFGTNIGQTVTLDPHATYQLTFTYGFIQNSGSSPITISTSFNGGVVDSFALPVTTFNSQGFNGQRTVSVLVAGMPLNDDGSALMQIAVAAQREDAHLFINSVSFVETANPEPPVIAP